jgi:hypothetical protein
MKKTKKARVITIAIKFEWEECDDVCAELMLEDGIELKKKGVSYQIIKDSYPILPSKSKKVKVDHLHYGKAM